MMLSGGRKSANFHGNIRAWFPNVNYNETAFNAKMGDTLNRDTSDPGTPMAGTATM